MENDLNMEPQSDADDAEDVEDERSSSFEIRNVPVICRTDPGESRRVILTHCDDRESHFVAMNPPLLGSTVHLKRESEGTPPGEIDGLVVETRYNPSDAWRCGFSVLVLDGSLRDSLMPSDNRKGGSSPRKTGITSGFERRRHPRIGISLKGALKFPGMLLDIVVGNLSMSGAFVKSVEKPLPDVLDIGTMLHLVILKATGAPLIALKAEIARLIGVGRPSSAGLRFIDLTPFASGILEQLILTQLIEERSTSA